MVGIYIVKQEEGLSFLLRQDLLELLDEAQLIVWYYSFYEIFTLIAGVPLVLDVHHILPALEGHGKGILGEGKVRVVFPKVRDNVIE